MERLTTLREALVTAEDSSDDAALFLPPDRMWSLDTPCAVLEIDRDDDGEIPPIFAQQHGLHYSLSVSQVQDIVSNVCQQVAGPSPEQLLTAFLFYYDRDAFIVFGSGA